MHTSRTFLILFFLIAQANAQEVIHVAVASNFTAALQDLAAAFTARTELRIGISSASTGKLYAQIRNGAPFDLLFAADSLHPRLLEQSGHALPDSRFTYAIGRIVLWSRDPTLTADHCRHALEQPGGRRIAIAHPDLAPYGAAAREALNNLGLWQRISSRLVTGENINQAFQFVATGNAQMGLISYSQLVRGNTPVSTCQWIIPENLYTPIEQQAVALRRSDMNPDATKFMAFVRSPEGRKIIEQNGYFAAN